MFKAFQIYNKRYHSTINISPEQAQNTNIETLITKLKNKKEKIIEKKNQTREDYNETRQEGYIKNYKHVRHKNFRYKNLDRVHTKNIKRPRKFTGSLVDATTPIDDNQPGTSNTCNNAN